MSQGEDAEIFTSMSVGDKVTVKHEKHLTRWRKPHLRTPGYLFGMSGVVERIVGNFSNPELGAYGRKV